LLPKIQQQLDKASILDYRQSLKDLRKLKEDELINQLIVPLFHKMGYSGVGPIRHHGPDEYGRDILPFYKVNEFGERDYYAVQVKAINVNAKASSQGNINSVINQAESALRKKFLDEDKHRCTVDRVLVVTSGYITPEAQAIADDYLEGNRKITLIDGNRLLGLLNSYDLIQNLSSLVPVRSVKIIPYKIPHGTSAIRYWSDIINQILSKLSYNMKLDPQACYNTLVSRERVMPTVVGDYLAFPHASDLMLDYHLIILCVSNRNHLWMESYQRLVNFAIVFLSPEGREHSTVLKIMDTIRTLVGDVMRNPDNYSLRPSDKLISVSNVLSKKLKTQGFTVKKEKIKELSIES